jgi:hypothetical protein
MKLLRHLAATLCLVATLLPAHAAPVAARVVTLKAADATVVAEITLDGATVKISDGKRVLTGVTSSAEKRRYTVSTGGVAIEVKAADATGFKVRDSAGKLLWKIKLSDAKIKISDNEENTDPFEIAQRESGIKVEKSAQKLGSATFSATFSATDHLITVSDPDGKTVCTSAADTPSLAPAVLLLPKATPEQKYIIIAELLSRGR